jgi:hypothetical protein
MNLACLLQMDLAQNLDITPSKILGEKVFDFVHQRRIGEPGLAQFGEILAKSFCWAALLR